MGAQKIFISLSTEPQINRYFNFVHSFNKGLCVDLKNLKIFGEGTYTTFWGLPRFFRSGSVS